MKKYGFIYARPDNMNGVFMVEKYINTMSCDKVNEAFKNSDMYFLLSDDINPYLLRLYRIHNGNIVYMMSGYNMSDDDRCIPDVRLTIILNTIREVYTRTYELMNGVMSAPL